MNSKLKIPQKIKVGFNEREDTYTAKLGFAISMDKRKTLPISFTNWIDDKFPLEDHDNTPIEGFVLNRDVGGTQRSYGWNARREKVRVYDPRDWEIEITVDNLLLILQECSSIKGKGLEGEFVYAWSGSQVVLLPVTSQEYKNSIEHQNLGKKKVSKSDMVEGCTYLTKDKENVMYMGRLEWFAKLNVYSSCRYEKDIEEFGKKFHIFLRLDSVKNKNSRDESNYMIEKGFTRLAEKTSDHPLPEYAHEYEKLSKTHLISPPNEIFLKPFKVIDNNNYRWYGQPLAIKNGDAFYIGFIKNRDGGYRSSFYRHVEDNDRVMLYDINCNIKLQVKNGVLVRQEFTGMDGYTKTALEKEKAEEIARTPYLRCENGVEYKLV